MTASGPALSDRGEREPASCEWSRKSAAHYRNQGRRKRKPYDLLGSRERRCRVGGDVAWLEGRESQNHWSGWSENLGESVVETNGGGQELVGGSDNATHEEVGWLHD